MRLALPDEKARIEPGTDPGQWAFLPAMCCQAAGGDPGWAEDVSSAWFLLYMAAHLYDDIQDQDKPNPWWLGMGVGAAINAASGLMLSGLSMINNLHQHANLNSIAGDISASFYRQGFIMISGQHLDLTTERPGVEDWFKIAEAKSGSFFELACWAGARLATNDADRLNGFKQFGSELGLLLQIYDDLEELRCLKDLDVKVTTKGIIRSLPLTYALEVLPEEAQQRLLESIQEASEDKRTFEEVFNMLDQCGAPLYLKIQIERRLKFAQAALDTAMPDTSVRDALLSYLHKFKFEENSE